jgi:hypothetical protein
MSLHSSGNSGRPKNNRCINGAGALIKQKIKRLTKKITV